MEGDTAAAKKRSLEIPPKDDGHSSPAAVPVRMFVFQSGALAALFPIVLWRARGDTHLAVWRLSLLLCSYFYSAACALSAAPAATKAGLPFHVSCVAIVAFFVDAQLSQIAGMMIIYLNSVVMAGVFGHALAEHRESDGAEQAASAAAAKTVKDKGKVAYALQSDMTDVPVVVVLVLIFVCVAGGAKWSADCRPHGGCTVAEFKPGCILFLMISGTLAFVMNFMEEAILGIEWIQVFGSWFLAVIVLGGAFFLLLGEVVGTVALWMILLGVTVFYGYYVRVHDSYVKIIWCHVLAAQMNQISAARFDASKIENHEGN